MLVDATQFRVRLILDQLIEQRTRLIQDLADHAETFGPLTAKRLSDIQGAISAIEAHLSLEGRQAACQRNSL